MSPDQDRVRIGVLLHRLFQALSQVLLMRRVLDDRYSQPVVVPQIALLAPPLRYAFDLLNLLDLEASVFAEVALDQQCDENRPLRVCVDAAAGAALEGGHEERCAGGGLEDLLTSVQSNISLQGAKCRGYVPAVF